MQRMLIVEDEPDLCDCLQEFFKARGFEVATAFSGEEAEDQLRERAADVILLDILLPGVSGLEVLRRVRETSPATRVIMVTSVDQAEVREEARRCGASAYITKPFDFSEATWSSVFASG